MPARESETISPAESFFHVYNRGIEKRVIFKEKEDYDVFLGFLKEYLTPPADAEQVKKEFRVKGRTYRGLPHQPKNYCNKVELISYALAPDHFHLLLRQITDGAIEGLIRSLCTRYSMYFNKKYKRTGSLFQGPYKSVEIQDTSLLLLLIRYFHSEHPENHYSSHQEYARTRTTSWVKSDCVVSFAGTSGLTNIVQRSSFSNVEKQNLETIIIEPFYQHLARSSPPVRLLKPFPKFEYKHVPPSERYPELVVISAVFVVLVSFGMRNIQAASPLSLLSLTPTPKVAGEATALPTPSPLPIELPTEPTKEVAQATPTPTEEPKDLLMVTIQDEAEFVNIRKEPSVLSEKIGETLEGDTFEEFSIVDSKWYEIKLADGTAAYVSANYVEIVQETNL